MPIKPSDILQCAGNLTRDTKGAEALCRAAVGRSYYAAYHDCSEWHANLPAPGDASGSKGSGVHVELSTRLTRPSASLPDEQKRLSRERGVALRKLHGDRVIADYRLNMNVTALQARTALAVAKQIFTLI